MNRGPTAEERGDVINFGSTPHGIDLLNVLIPRISFCVTLIPLRFAQSSSLPNMSSSPSQPATADSGYITQPGPLENTYTSDTSLRRALECELHFQGFCAGFESDTVQGISHLRLYNL